MLACMHSSCTAIECIADIFKGENFHQFHKSIAISKNHTLQIFTKCFYHISIV